LILLIEIRINNTSCLAASRSDENHDISVFIKKTSLRWRGVCTFLVSNFYFLYPAIGDKRYCIFVCTFCRLMILKPGRKKLV